MGMDLKGLGGSSRSGDGQREADFEQREKAFRDKVAVQQFLNHNGPLFSAFARAGVAIDEVVEGEVLRVPAAQAARLAVLVAARAGKCDPSEVKAADARPFRAAAANYVASRWLIGKPIDVDRAAMEISAAVDLVDKTWDDDPYKDDGISTNASLLISGLNAVTALMPSVEKYDFRGGKTEVLRRLYVATVEASSTAAASMLGKNASEADIRNVTQTATRNLATILEACYERKAREVVHLLNGRPIEERLAWYERNDPVGDVIASFREWTLCFAGFAVAASRDMSSRQADERSPARETVPPATTPAVESPQSTTGARAPRRGPETQSRDDLPAAE